MSSLSNYSLNSPHSPAQPRPQGRPDAMRDAFAQLMNVEASSLPVSRPLAPGGDEANIGVIQRVDYQRLVHVAIAADARSWFPCPELRSGPLLSGALHRAASQAGNKEQATASSARAQQRLSRGVIALNLLGSVDQGRRIVMALATQQSSEGGSSSLLTAACILSVDLLLAGYFYTKQQAQSALLAKHEARLQFATDLAAQMPAQPATDGADVRVTRANA